MEVFRGALTVLLTFAAVGDVRTGRVSNRLILAGLGMGLCYRIREEGPVGFISFCIHAGVPVILLFILFLMRVLGAGDIKLFSIISSVYSFREWGICFAATFVIGAVWALAQMLHLRNLNRRLISLGIYIRTILVEREIFPYPFGAKEKEHTLPFSVAILLGYLFSLGVCR